MRKMTTRWRWVKCGFSFWVEGYVWKEGKKIVALRSYELPGAQVKGKGDDLSASPIKVGMKSFYSICIWKKSDSVIHVIV